MARASSLLALIAIIGNVVAVPTPIELRATQDLHASANRKGLNGSHGAVATEVKLCSDIGVDILKQGGNAADAMIAAQLCVGIVAGYHSGIGGGGFMTVRSASGSYEVIDFREFAPGAATELMYANSTNGSQIGGLSVAVPSELRGFEALHRRHGKLSWKKIFAPAIDLCQNGFKVTRELALAVTPKYPFLSQDPIWAAVYAPNGTLAVVGQTIYRPTLAKTLTTIANHGVEPFYEGPMAERTIKAIQKRGGIMTLADLKKYKVEIREAVKINYRNYTVYSAPAPASGVIALSALNILSGYDISNSSNINQTTHLLDEAIKFAYAQRESIGDPAFVSNVTSLEAYYLESSTASDIRKRIDLNQTHEPAYYDPVGYYNQPDHGTSHLVSADDSGLVVSLTSTVNYYYGSQIMTTDGIILNDEMDDFSTPGTSNGFGYIATVANYIRPYKRPLSSISPSIVENKAGEFVFATGAAGGSRIITSTLQSLWHVLDQGMDAQSAINAPRLHDQIFPMTTTFEYNYNNATTAYMASLGHNVTWVGFGQSTVQGITRNKQGVFEPASDGRKLDSGATSW